MIQPIVLAAGFGTRMGGNKALLPIGDVPALTVVLSMIEAAGLSSPIIVLGHNAEAVKAAVDLEQARVVINLHPQGGISRSLALALEAIQADSTGILVFHVDMPFLAHSTVRAVVDAANRGAVLAAPVHGETRGFPVYFARDTLDALKASLQGDSGGRAFLRTRSTQLTRVLVDDPGCVFDIDSPSDLRTWKGEPLCAISE